MLERMHSAAVRAPMLWSFVTVAVSIAVGDALMLTTEAAAALALLALVALARAVRSGRGVYLAALAVLAGAAALAATAAVAPPAAETCGDASELWQVRVVAPRGRAFDGVSGRLERPTLVELVAERCDELWSPRRGRVNVSLWSGTAVAQGDVLMTRLRLEPIASRRNPTDPDPFIAARRDGLAAFAVARGPYAFVRKGEGPLAAIDRARDAVAAAFEAALPRELATISKALSMGDQSAVDDAMRERWSVSGLAHLLSVSGLHVSLVAALAFFVLRLLLSLLPGAAERWSLRRAAALATLPFVAGFCVWSGASAPALRSTIMASAFLVGLVLARPHAVLNSVGLAGALILLASPPSLYSPGFLLSFVAVLGLLLVQAPEPTATRWARARQALAGLLATSVVATLATAPLGAAFFGRTSLVGPLSNLVAVPLGSAVATPLALLFSVVAPLSSTPAAVVALPLHGCAWLLDRIAAWSADLPFAAVDVAPPSALDLVVYYVGLVALLVAPRRRAGQVIALCAAVTLGGARVVTAVWPSGLGQLHVSFPYVGQGDAIVARLPDGAVMLVDAGGPLERGGPDPGRRVLAPLLRRAGVRDVDLAVLTHPDPDHLGGFAYLAQHFRIRELWWSGAGDEGGALAALLASVRASGGVVRLAAELPARVERHGVKLEVLHPRPGAAGEGLPYFPELDLNDNSLVLRLVHGARSLLLPGDVEAETEARLAAALSPSDVLKAPHHGSATSSSEPLLGALAPRLVVVSCGAHNRFGFPSQAVLARYAAHGARVLRTDRDGMIELVSDGRRWSVTTARGVSLTLP